MTKLAELKMGDRFYLGEYVKCMVLDDADFPENEDSSVWVAILSGGMQYHTGETWCMVGELDVERES